MAYRALATSKTPALIIYLLDVSASMSQDCGGTTRIEVVTQALQKVAIKMVQRSTKGTTIAPRYRVAMFAYSSQVIDLLGGVKPIDELARMGVPRLTTLDLTDTAAAFETAETLLLEELPDLQEKGCPAPLVCHMTDGEYNGADPTSIAQRIQKMSVPDGNVLVENIYVKSDAVPLPDIDAWPGILSEAELTDSYSKTLFQMSSPIPETYRNVMREFGYQLQDGARMFFPGDQSEIVELGFAMSGATPVTA